ncbi:hypothetical protein DSCO28_04420 [Desulfosarcina ovata subsp. sediminis]|uniref:Chemotaxis protein CheA n=1 Tax=Desulfosarcina ovata subsp. sediminis TaxID=885957 RepID=A0A5K7ZFZ6_9BACT|nr:chemotaxis protein CheA [Desulfosarcina ovata]BBO79876.1 hypothetical protein DSCO28_04420 [Desulfosarcina ovata subsp. sediminis]
MTDHSLTEDFADESREHLEELEGCLLRLESAPSDRELLGAIFRSVHTIKGASEYLGFERIAELTHRLETLLDLFREGRLKVDKVAVDLLIDARDRMGELVGQVETGGRESAQIDDLLERISAIVENPMPAAEQDADLVYDDEADTELFDIFIEQLVAGLDELVATAGRWAGGGADAGTKAALRDQVERLASTANYMGYDALNAVYADLDLAVEQCVPALPGNTHTGNGSLLGSSVAGTIERIRQLFPKADALASIDTRGLSAWPDDVGGEDGAIDAPPPNNGAAGDLLAESIDDELEFPLDMDDTDAPSAPDTYSSDSLLVKDFADESREHLEELEGCLLRLESAPSDSELLGAIFRSVHTIKGASEYLGFERIAELTHRLENLLDRFREGRLEVDKVAVDLLIDARDRMGELVGQVETGGRETAQIDDLLERVSAMMEDPMPGAEQDATPVYDGEADTELFDIFIEQLVAGLDELVATAGRWIDGGTDAETKAALRDQVERLASTANYMGYDALNAVYADLGLTVERCDPALPGNANAGDGSSLGSSVAGTIERIRQLFPKADALAAVDTRVRSLFYDGPLPAAAHADLETRSSADIDDVLAALPAINEHDREELLSKTLDETFDAMGNDGAADPDPVDAQDDDDPIGLNFLTCEDNEAEPMPVPGTDDPDAAPLGIMDAFGAEQATPVEESSRSADMPSLSAAVDAGTELWPRAPEEATLPEAPTAPDAPALTDNDFSEPQAQEVSEEAPATDGFVARSTVRKSIRVDAQKVDDLMNQVGELVVNRSSFTQIFQEMRDLVHYLGQRFPMDKGDHRLLTGLNTRLMDATTVLGRVTGELQEQVMKVRMLPISRLFNRYPRLVHDLIKASDKKVQLQFQGEETELDRMVIEQLADPLIHVIRNAVDHGIEPCEKRKRKGKPEKGTLLLNAYHEGSNVIVEITDDGNGIDLSRIRQKAIEKQLADRETLEQMDQRALINMIMLPGFSTADQITHTSGRGVGMDVVKQSLEKINGVLSIDTRQDVGTRIRIKIPLTLAIIPALMLRCGDSHFTLPLGAVEETLRIDRGEIFTVDGSQMMHLHEEPLPLVRLTDLLNIAVPSAGEDEERLFVVVVKATTGQTGLIVDALLGRQEVVIKPLEDYLQESSGFSGATILGDGKISLILNVDELVVMAREREAEKRLAAAVF